MTMNIDKFDIRMPDGDMSDALSGWVHDRLERHLGKYSAQIESIDVRFADENGPKGGVDRNCMIHVTISALPPIVVEVKAGEEREAFDLAAGRMERAVKRSMEKHGFSMRYKGRQRAPHGAPDGS